ncbi:unnamed protein product [Sphagnum jensenii]
MPERLLNDFLVGADPELILLDPPELINGQAAYNGSRVRPHYGWDHGGWVVEPHPTPHRSVRAVCRNIKTSLDVMAHDFPNWRFRAGAYYKNGRQRSVTLGGHVHLDIPRIGSAQLGAMDTLAQSFVALNILPAAECGLRCSNPYGYGRCGDVRAEHGHVEYRTLCSWLFSRKTSMLCMTGIKLAAIAPETVKTIDSIEGLEAWVTLFKGKDDDVDWILDKGYFSKSLEAKPDANVKSVWQVNEELGKGIVDSLKKAASAIPARRPATRQQNFPRGRALRVFWQDSTQLSGWQYGEEVPVHIERVATLGWVVSSSKDGINMTTSLSKNGGALSLVAIPWLAITHIQELPEWDRNSNLP